MGAFLLVADKSDFNAEAAVEVMRLQCMTRPDDISLPGWRLILFPKFLSEKNSNVRTAEDHSLYSVGTPYIYGKTHDDSLDDIFNDLPSGINAGSIRGLFFMLFLHRGKLSFTTDSSGIYSIYHTTDGNVISSSFLAIVEGIKEISVNKKATTENLLTGTIIGSDTIFNEIRRFEPSNPFDFRNLAFIYEPLKIDNETRFANRRESIKSQIEALDNYFSGIKKLAEESGIDSGITGGFDSRLLLVMCLRHFDKDKIQFHSHLRKNPGPDFLAGKEICQQTGLKFIEQPVSDISDINEEKLLGILNSGMLFNDGQVRTHSFWHEEFNTSSYRLQVLGNKRLGMGGIGGEQYRNQERVVVPNANLKNWVMNELVLKYSGFYAADKKTINDTTSFITEKIIDRGCFNRNLRGSLADLKKYMNVIYTPANRGLRSSHENRLSYFLYPFTDQFVADTAARAVPFLGASLNYEAEMIKMINPEIASVRNSYKFNFVKGESAMSYIPHLIINNFVPSGIRSRIKERMSTRSTNKWTNPGIETENLVETLKALNPLNLSISIPEIVKRTDLGPLAFEMGYLMNKYLGKIKV